MRDADWDTRREGRAWARDEAMQRYQLTPEKKGQQRVLAVLFGNPGRNFYASEIIALASSGTGAVQRELARLENAGLVTARRVGNQKHYQANPEAPVFEEVPDEAAKRSSPRAM